MLVALREPAWHADAACRDADPELFDVPEGKGRWKSAKYKLRIARAREICNGCPVAVECLISAIDLDDQHTVRGGMVPDERAELDELAAA